MMTAQVLTTASTLYQNCYLEDPKLAWLYVISNVLTAIAYSSFPLALLYCVRKYPNLPFPKIRVLCGAFIVLCAMTALTEICSLWYVNYWVGSLKALTAVLSVYIASQLIPVVPQALSSGSPQLKAFEQELEQCVQERTAQLETIIEDLRREIATRQQATAGCVRLLEKEQEVRAEAESANRIKDEFLAVLSHELRTPLNPILGWAQALQMYQFDETKTAVALATIERNAQLQVQMIDDLLDVARILRGKLSLNFTCVNLASVIKAAVETVETTAATKSISLETALPNIGQVWGDAVRLQQIVWNLLTNAVKFTPEGGQVKIELNQVGNQAQIIVKDTGKGISADFLPHIFKLFYQEDASTTRRYGGLGLGLAIAQQLVEAHDGTITADSSGEGLGATFTLRFTLLNEESGQPDAAPCQQLSLAGIRVLGVDDEPDTRELLTVLLTRCGAEVLTVASAAEALSTLNSLQPDVLISDISMPEVDGLELLKQVRSLPSETSQIPAIALTAYTRDEDCQKIFASGYQRHVAKPFKLEHLVQAIVVAVSPSNGSVNRTQQPVAISSVISLN